MKNFLVLLFVSFAASKEVQKLQPLDSADAVKFTVQNLGFTVSGSFSGLNGTILFDENNLPASFFNISINASSVNTGNNLRDKHLKDEDYFDAAKYPLIKIESVKIAKSVTTGYLVFFGKLTIKDKTQDISFPFKVVADQNNYRFTGEFKMKRRDFGIGGKSTVSNDVNIKLNVLTKKL